MNRIDIDLGIEFPDGSIKWWPKGPFWMDMPRFGQDEGFPEPVFVTARDGMKELLVDIFTGVFEPQKIAGLSNSKCKSDKDYLLSVAS